MTTGTPRVAVLSPLGVHTGNRSTALRLQQLLDGVQFTALMAPDVFAQASEELLMPPAPLRPSTAALNVDVTSVRSSCTDSVRGGMQDATESGSALAEWGRSHSIQLVVALHAFRSGALVVGAAWQATGIHFVLVFGGTDLSTYTERAETLQVMTAAVGAAQR